MTRGGPSPRRAASMASGPASSPMVNPTERSGSMSPGKGMLSKISDPPVTETSFRSRGPRHESEPSEGAVGVRKDGRCPTHAYAHLVRRSVTPGHEVRRDLPQNGELLSKGRVIGAGDLDRFTGGDRNGRGQVVGQLMVEVIVGNTEDRLRLGSSRVEHHGEAHSEQMHVRRDPNQVATRAHL